MTIGVSSPLPETQASKPDPRCDAVGGIRGSSLPPTASASDGALFVVFFGGGLPQTSDAPPSAVMRGADGFLAPHFFVVAFDAPRVFRLANSRPL